MSRISELFIRPNPFEPDPAEFGAPEEKPRHWRIQLVEDTHAAAKARDAENVCPTCKRPLGSTEVESTK
jgi:hypothetical protein